MLDYTYDLLLGNERFSMKSFVRTSVIYMLLLVVSLAINGLRLNAPFGFSKSPIEFYNTQLEMSHTLQETYTKTAMSATDEHVRQINNRLVESLKRFEITFRANKYMYILSFVLAMLIVGSCTYSASLSISRLLLREIIETDSPILSCGILCLALIYAVMTGTIVILILFCVYTPVVLPVAIEIFSLSIPVGLALLIPVLIGVWLFGFIWLQVTASLVLLPTTLLCISMVLSIILYPIRKPLYMMVSNVLLRGSQYEKGLFIFTAGLMTFLAVALGSLAKFIK